MANNTIAINELSVKPIDMFLYSPPLVWKGDRVGHMGINNTFFFVMEGECFLNIDNEYSIIRPGQLAFLPKGKKRAYTHISERFCMYEMAFAAEADGKDIMEVLGLTDGNYVVDVHDIENMSRLFESSFHKELFKEPVYDVVWCANILNIINCYADARTKTKGKGRAVFEPVLTYMLENINKNMKTEELASLVYMQPTYFIKRFKDAMGVPPSAYLNRLRMYKAMELLSATSEPIEYISEAVGIADTSYFARMFKKNCGSTPSEYRKAFK